MGSLEQFLENHTGRAWKIAGEDPVGGGCIHDARRIRTSDGDLFVKRAQGSQGDLLRTESLGLQAIEATRTLRTPAVIACGSLDDTTFLILEWMDLRSLDPSSGAVLGEQLAALHSAPQKGSFGWEHDNFIGSTPQQNTPLTNWPEFFATRRLEPQIRRASGNGFQLPSAEPLLSGIKSFFPEAPTRPAALHGDLWGGNAAASAEGQPVLFDPAFYRGDPETDIAFSRFFGGFPGSFYKAYESKIPPRLGWKSRQTLYNLYHVLNHLNLFGSSYLGQARRMISELNEQSRRS